MISSYAKHAFDACQIRDRLGIDHGSIEGITRNGLETVVIVDKLLSALMELEIILFGPPVAKISVLVILASGRIKGVGDFMCRDHTDMSQLFLIGHPVVIETAAQNACGDVDGVVKRIVVGVDILRGCNPGFPVDRLVDFFRDGKAGVLGNSDPGINQGAALIRTFKVQNTFCTFALSCVGSGSS